MLGLLNPEDINQEIKDLMAGNYVSKDIPPFSY
jgi:hypothetical protein